jgi:NDP-4-keto-2,6-dideoxyhexose 3-C-methyltransferase
VSVTTIKACRICGNRELVDVVDLGEQAFTGLFPRPTHVDVPYGPLQVVRCNERNGGCGLVQLRHSFAPDQMYGDTYGYRSGLNQSMVTHLQRRVEDARRRVSLSPGDVVLDIGSNDCTTLRSYGDSGYRLVGIDPSAAKFRRFYPAWVEPIPAFFSAETFRKAVGDARAKIVTSIAMFYDLEDPTAFMREVREVLDDEGIWVFEQSYLPLMVERNAYDTICHEHVSYYGLRQIEYMARAAGLRVIDVEINDVNGGSFCVTAAKAESQRPTNQWVVDAIRERELNLGYGDTAPYAEFREQIVAHRNELRGFVADVLASGQRICGYGASTKGNVLLQFCGFTPRELPLIAEVNEDKFGCVTPHSRIPIVSEAAVRETAPDYMLVLPWHFREGIVRREQAWLASGGRLVFPLPRLEVVGGKAALRRAA